MKKFALMIAAMLVMVPFSMNAGEPATAAGDNESNFGVTHPFKSDSDTTSHWSMEVNGFYLGMGVKHSWEAINNSFEVGLLNFAAINYNSLHGQNLSLGVGINHRSYSMKRPGMLVRDDAGVISLGSYPETNIDLIKNRTSNLNMWSIQFPLMFRQRIYKKLEFSVAGIMNWNVYARADNHYEMNKVDHDTHYKGLKQNKICFDAMGALTVGATGIYCRYSPGKFFKDGYGPEIKNTWTLGIAMGL